MAKTFKPKSHEVDAVQWDGENVEEVRTFMGKASVNARGTSLHILTSKTAMALRKGDYLVKKEGDDVTAISEKQFTDQYEVLEKDTEAKEEKKKENGKGK